MSGLAKINALPALKRSFPRINAGAPTTNLDKDGLGRVPGDVVFSKLSKMLNQEDALSAPCLRYFRNYCCAIKNAFWLAADARVKRAGATQNRAVVIRKPRRVDR